MDKLRLELAIRTLCTLLGSTSQQVAYCKAEFPSNYQLLIRLMKEQLTLQGLIISALRFYLSDDAILSADFDQRIFDIQLAELLGTHNIIIDK